VKVLHVIPSIGPARGGPSEMVRTLVRSLAAAGLEVHLATTDDNGAERLAITAPEFTADGVAYHVFPRQFRHYTVSLPLARWVRGHAGEFDVVHIHAVFSHASIAAARAAGAASVPYIVRPLGTLGDWEMAHGNRFEKALSLRFVEAPLLRAAALLHYTTDAERLQAERRIGAPPAAVIPNPVDEPASLDGRRTLFRLAHPELSRRFVVASVSRLDAKKRIELLLDACKLAVGSGIDLHLVVAGTGTRGYEQELRSRAASLGLVDRVTWAGYVGGDAKWDLLAGADVLALVSHSENFGIAAAEAMACGVPVVLSEGVGIASEVAAAGAGIAVAGDTTAVAAALGELAADAVLRSQMGEAAGHLARERYSPGAVARSTISMYERACGLVPQLAASTAP